MHIACPCTLNGWGTLHSLNASQTHDQKKPIWIANEKEGKEGAEGKTST